MALAKTCGRSVVAAALLLVSVGLTACTTTEGTNAFTSAQTFETEVMDKTAQGLGLIPAPVKPDPTNPRGPLVIPKDTRDLPPPQDDTVTAMLPVDDSTPKIDTTGLSQADIEHVKHVRVVDINTPDGRPLTAAELSKLTSRMKAYTLSSKRSIFTPPEQYFTLDGGQKDLVCLSKSGDLVPVNDPSCPIEIRKALLKQG